MSDPLTLDVEAIRKRIDKARRFFKDTHPAFGDSVSTDVRHDISTEEILKGHVPLEMYISAARYFDLSYHYLLFGVKITDKDIQADMGEVHDPR